MTKFIVTVMLPGAGDAKRIAEKENAELFSFDAVKEGCQRLGEIQEAVGKFFEEKKRSIARLLASGKNVVFDTTPIPGKLRAKFLFELQRAGVQTIAIFAATPVEMCLEKLKSEGKEVDMKVFNRLYHNFEIPYYFEGWDKIEIVYPENMSGYTTTHIRQLFNRNSELYAFDQESDDHSLSLGNHLFETFKHVAERSCNRVLKEAALLHDIGKPKVKKLDSSGDASYPQHQYISAYDSMFEVSGCFDSQMKLLRAVYIQWHMTPYFIGVEMFEVRYLKLFGNEMLQNLLLLHEGDLCSH